MKKIDRPKNIILPIGSFEHHGDHLPFETDVVIAEKISHYIAEKLPNTTVLPVVAYGMAKEHKDYIGSVDINVHSFINYINNILEDISKIPNIELVILMNGHGGNNNVLELIANNWCYEHNIKVIKMTPYTKKAIEKAENLFGEFDTHGGSVETSLYNLFINNNESLEIEDPKYIKKLSKGFRLFKSSQITNTGIITDKGKIVSDINKAQELLKVIRDSIIEEINSIKDTIKRIHENE